LLICFALHDDEILEERTTSGQLFGTPSPNLALSVAGVVTEEVEETVAPREMKDFVESRLEMVNSLEASINVYQE
jgi:hypothetical protein